MQRKLSNRCGKTSSSEEFISQHMSNHYRRVLNAKKVVDTSAPHSYKSKGLVKKSSMNRRNNPAQNRNESPAVTDRSMSTGSYRASSWGAESVINSSRYHANCVPLNQRNLNARRQFVDMDLINQIAYDTKNGPGMYCDSKWVSREEETVGKTNYDCRSMVEKPQTASSPPRRLLSAHCCNDSNQTSSSSIQKKSKVMIKPTQSMGAKPHPKKIEAVSKLRSLRVYHPPRRRKKRDDSEQCPGISNAMQDKRLDICLCSGNVMEVKKLPDQGKEQTSSRDSAYNGGVSSLPDSRSPTPDNRNKSPCGCPDHNEIYIKERHYYEKVTKNDEKASQKATKIQEEKPKAEDEALKKMKEDALYVKFVQDITVEILEKGLFTNKALKKVMKRHIINNLDKLDKDRMIREVENLRIQLGVPEDKSILEVECKDDTASLEPKAYPVVSDSAFTVPENIKTKQTRSRSVAKTISEVIQFNEESDLDTTTDEDLISMIQVAKKIRDRTSAVETSSDEGTEKKKKRAKVSPQNKSATKGAFPYSSESEESAKKSVREARKDSRKKQAEVDKKWKSKCPCKGKADCGNSLMENKHIKLVVYENENQKTNSKSKTKND